MFRKGDMVRVGTEAPMHGVILATSRDGQRRGHLKIRTLCRQDDVRDVRTGDVTAHWRLVKAK
jgi:hypothetical protein